MAKHVHVCTFGALVYAYMGVLVYMWQSWVPLPILITVLRLKCSISELLLRVGLNAIVCVNAVASDTINCRIHQTGMQACMHASMVYATNLLVVSSNQ